MSDPKGSLSYAAQQAGNSVAETADKVSEVASQAGTQAGEFLSEIESTIRQNPWLAVLAAAAFGYTWGRIRR
jgi:ElaB/YqjD/DUF883 family membrane-anchored ribosome-binding protein